MKVLVCGGRDYHDVETFTEVMDELLESYEFTRVIHGGAFGADALADRWALNNGLDVEVFLPSWELYGRAAGPIRNQQMIDDSKPDLVVAFPGGRGTADMVRRAHKAGVNIIETDDEGCFWGGYL